ncbi:hypothetical protein [Thioclava sp.]|uniref:hypothetical protein n=1 Tax=Thioclava sp. TaxID=1933450 RepID=UPI003AA89A54
MATPTPKIAGLKVVDKPDTPLAKLLENAGIGVYAQSFDDLGFTDLGSLGEGAEDWEANIGRVVDQNEKPGHFNKLIAMLRQQTPDIEPAADDRSTPAPGKPPADKPAANTGNKAQNGNAKLPKPGTPPKPLALPKLPSGTTLDLKKAQFEAEGIKIDLEPKITVPSKLADVFHADQLTQLDWLKIVKRNDILWGIDLDKVALKKMAPRVDSQALVWRVPDDDGYYSVRSLGAESAADVSYSTFEHSLVVNRIDSAKVNVATPFASVAAQAELFRRVAKLTKMRTLHLYGAWTVPKVQLYLNKCTEITKDFVKDIKAALSQSNNQEKFDALESVFGAYGHAVPKRLTIGAVMFHSREESVSSDVAESTIKHTIEAGVAAAKDGAQADATYSFKNGRGESVSAVDFSSSASWHAYGGDVSLLSQESLGKWLESTKNPNNWGVISIEEIEPLVNRLDETLKAAVNEVWDSIARQMWNGHNTPSGTLLPEGRNKPITIAEASDDNARAIVGESIATHYDNDTGGAVTTYPLLTSGAIDPQKKGTLWRLVYSGRSGPGDLPTYWIVEHAPDDIDKFLEDKWDDIPGMKILAAGVTGGKPSISVNYLAERTTQKDHHSINDLLWMVLPCAESAAIGTRGRPYRLIPLDTARNGLDGGMGFNGVKLRSDEIVSFSEDGRVYLRVHDL